MFQLLRAGLSQNHGVITAGEARDSGLTPSEITALVHGGSLVRVRRGVYADGEVWRAADEFRGRPLLRVRAAVARLQRGWVLSHDSAAFVLGLPLIAPHESDVHVTRPGYAQSWPRAGIVRHYASYVEEHVVRDGDLPHLDAARTAVDLAREHGVEAGLVACDAALRAGVSTDALRAAYQPMSCYHGIITARRAVSLADPRAESAAESLARLLVIELGIGDVDAQFPVRIEDGRTAWCDLRVGNHVFEVDGRWKYRSQADGGVAARPGETVIWEEKKRPARPCPRSRPLRDRVGGPVGRPA